MAHSDDGKNITNDND
jgi:hypothetical protein